MDGEGIAELVWADMVLFAGLRVYQFRQAGFTGPPRLM